MHLTLAGLFIVGSVAGAYYYLLFYTKQDEIVEVPNLEGMDLFEAEQFLAEVKLEATVVDSLYLVDHKGGEIVNQEPQAADRVKQNRKVYLTIARHKAPIIRMPNVLNQTLPLALAKLGSYGINVKEIRSEPSDCIDCVIDVEFEGESIETGYPLAKNASLVLVIGEGDTGEKVSVPGLYGLTASEAKQLLNRYSLNVGATPCGDCETKEDSLSAIIFKQNPGPSVENQISRGSSIDVYLTIDHTKLPAFNVDSLKALLR